MILGEKANQLVWQHIAMEFSSKTLSDQVAPKMVVYKHMDTQTDICIVCKNYRNQKSTTLPTCYIQLQETYRESPFSVVLLVGTKMSNHDHMPTRISIMQMRQRRCPYK